MNLNKLMKQAQKMQEQMAKTQAELEDKTVEVQAAGGKVTVVANGAGDVISLKIDKQIVDPEDVEFLEEAVLSGVRQAIAWRGSGAAALPTRPGRGARRRTRSVVRISSACPTGRCGHQAAAIRSGRRRPSPA